MDSTNKLKIDEVKAYQTLTKKLKGSTKYQCIVTTGRGGLAVAQRLAYLLDLPVVIIGKWQVNNLKHVDLFVDDIVCTGTTIGLLPRNVDTAVLVHRKSALYKPTYAGLVYEGDEYIKFSWEVI